MTYDRRTAGSGPGTLATGGEPIDLSQSDFDVPDTVKAIVLTAPGNVVCRAMRSTVDIALVGLPAGYILPWHCSHIRKDGTTASLATAEG